MAQLKPVTAGMRFTNEDNKSVCSVRNVSHSVTAETAAAFTNAIETLYNNGPCDARLNIAYDVIR